jgi:hypothetical protein
LATAAGEADRDEPRGAEAAPARRASKPRRSSSQERIGQRIDFRSAATSATRHHRPAPGRPVFPPAAGALCRPVRAEVRPQAEDVAISARAPLLAMDDIDRACTAEIGAITQDFGRRLAGARSPSERRAIKIARKSAIAAARQKAKLLKAGRRGANAAARQRAPRRQHRPPKPRR